MFIIRRDGGIQYVKYPHQIIDYKPFMSGAYFNGNVYCFGDFYPDHYKSVRFHLDRNQWFGLIKTWPSNPLTQCNCMTFNENILIASNLETLIRYSIANNSYAMIPFQFLADSIKILLNAGRLYLIEAKGGVYESEIGQDDVWRRISGSMIDNILQIDISYYKGEAFISCGEENYYKFNFNTKELTKFSN